MIPPKNRRIPAACTDKSCPRQGDPANPGIHAASRNLEAKDLRPWSFTLVAALVLCAIPALHAQSVRQIVVPKVQQIFGVPAISIQPSFALSYGQTTKVCANVLPLTQLTSLSFVSEPQGALLIQPLAQACDPNNNVTLVVTATTTLVCSATGNIKVKMNGYQVFDASGNLAQSAGAITLPTFETHAYPPPVHTCSQARAQEIANGVSANQADLSGFGGVVSWDITYGGSGVASADFTGVIASETITLPLLPTSAFYCPLLGLSVGGRPIGESGFNQTVDNLSYCPGITDPQVIARRAGCIRVFYQRVSAGQCFLQQNVTGFRFNQDLSFSTFRSDPNAISPQPGAFPLSAQQ